MQESPEDSTEYWGPYEDKDGYLFVNLKPNKKSIRLHRYLLEKAGFDLTGKEVHHKDGNKKNNSLDNLEILDPADHIKIHRPVVYITVECVTCGRKFQQTPGRINDNAKKGRKPCCSLACAARQTHKVRKEKKLNAIQTQSKE